MSYDRTPNPRFSQDLSLQKNAQQLTVNHLRSPRKMPQQAKWGLLLDGTCQSHTCTPWLIVAVFDRHLQCHGIHSNSQIITTTTISSISISPFFAVSKRCQPVYRPASSSCLAVSL